PYSSARDFASEIASYGPDVVAVEPLELRDLVVQRLEAVLAPTHRELS
ncbi:MAG: DNA-binding transcriptional regulator, partial [Actinomycetales bacterium]